MNISDSPRLLGEDILSEDDLKTRLYPLADRAIVNLDPTPQSDHVRAHLVQPTVMMVAATSSFRSTSDRPRGVALLRTLADLLERKQLDQIPWGPSNKAHKPVIRTMIEKRLGPRIDYDDGGDGMFSLMSALDEEFGEVIDNLLERFTERAEGAREEVVFGFLVQFLLRRYAQVEETDLAWSTVRNAAIDEGWIEP